MGAFIGMEQPSLIERSAISSRLKALGRDRAWLAGELHVSEGVVNQWLSARGNFHATVMWR